MNVPFHNIYRALVAFLTIKTLQCVHQMCAFRACQFPLDFPRAFVENPFKSILQIFNKWVPFDIGATIWVFNPSIPTGHLKADRVINKNAAPWANEALVGGWTDAVCGKTNSTPNVAA